MAGIFRLGFHRIAPKVRNKGAEDWHWSLAAADPIDNLLSGSFPTSDGQSAPYRLWLSDKPRALVLLLHGAFDYSGAFDEIGPRLAKKGMTALAFDQRGFGATQSRRHWCGTKRMVLDAVEAVRFLRARCGALPVFIVGESMGADIAIQTVAATRDLAISGLILAAPGAVADLFRRFLWRIAVQALNFFAPKSEIHVERMSGRELTPAGAIRLLTDPLVLRSVRPAMAAGLLELAVSTVAAARDVEVPTLTFVGSKEDFLYTACVARLHKAMAGQKTWRIVEGGPHLLFHWNRGAEVVGEALKWIEAELSSDPSQIVQSELANPPLPVTI